MHPYDNAEYIGRWNGKYVYDPYLESGDVLITGFPRYILLDKEKVEDFIDTEFFVKPRK